MTMTKVRKWGAMLGMATVMLARCHAANWLRVEDFQERQPGPLGTAGTGWSVLSTESTRALVADDRTAQGNKALKIQHLGPSDSGNHDIVWHNGAVDISPGKTSTIFLRFLVENGADQLGNIAGTEPVQSLATAFVIGGLRLHAGNAMGGVRVQGRQSVLLDMQAKGPKPPLALKRNRWYRLWLVIDNRPEAVGGRSYALLAEDSSTEPPARLDGVILKPGNNLIIGSIGVIKPRSDNLTDIWIDDIYVDNAGENVTNPLTGAARGWKEHVAAEAAKYRQYTRQADTWEEAQQQARHLVEAMTPSERFALVCGDGQMGTLGFPRLGILPVLFNDASQGINNGGPGDNRRERLPRTVAYPAANLLAATWDPEIARDYARSIGEECRSGGTKVLLGPSINMVRTAVCGRNFEYFGEDPLLACRMTTAYVQGIQSVGVAANLKVLLLNEIETHRRGSNSRADERTIREIYLPPMLAGVAAGALTVMSSYNQVNGEWGGESRYLNTTLLREVMGFQGVSMTDWIGTYDGVKLAACGTDLEMPGGWALLRSREKLLGSPDIDRMARRVLATWIKAGFFEEHWAKPELEQLRPQWEQTARRTNLEGIVLLKNGGLLPLADRYEGKTILVTGANANRKELSGNGSGHVMGYNHVTYVEACQAAFPKATVVTNAAPTAAQISSADLILVFPGFLERPRKDWQGSAEGEGQDRTFVMPDDKLIADCVAGNPRTIVAIVAGGAVAMDWADQAAAILHVSYGGQTAAPAFMDLITGAAEPSGRLTFTVERTFSDSPAPKVLEMKMLSDPARSLAPDDVPGMAKGNFFVDPATKRLTVADVCYDEGVFMGYRWYESKKIPVRYPFGFGLGFTIFVYENLKVDVKGPTAKLSFTLKNTGKRSGAEVAQVYVSDADCSVPRPPQELKAFQKVWLEAGQSKRVEIELGSEAFRFWNPATKQWTIEPGEFEIRVGASSADIRLRGNVKF